MNNLKTNLRKINMLFKCNENQRSFIHTALKMSCVLKIGLFCIQHAYLNVSATHISIRNEKVAFYFKHMQGICD